jgi:Wiskott-Aldrich syndrome protein
LEFADDGEATVFNKKIQDREALLKKELSTEKHSSSLFGAHKAKRKSKIDKNHIGMPADFR